MRPTWGLVFLAFATNAFAESFQCDGVNVSVQYKQMDPPSASGWERVILKANKNSTQIARQYEYVHFKIGCWSNPKGKQYIIYQAYCGGNASYCNYENNWGIIDPAVTQALLDPSPDNRPKAEKIFGGQLRWERWDEEAGARRHPSAFDEAGKGGPQGALTGATLSVDGKSIIYRAAPQGAPLAEFQFETKGYRNTYSLDCSRRQFLWTSNVELATGQSTSNTAGAQWRPITGDSKIAGAVFQAVCNEVAAADSAYGAATRSMTPPVASGPAPMSSDAFVEFAADGDVEVINQLIGEGINVNARHRYDHTALIAASERGHLPIVQTLLAKGADVNARTKFGSNALYRAAAFGHREIVDVLLANGADVNGGGGDNGPLIGAVMGGQPAIVQTLLAKGADVNVKTATGATALMIASGMNTHERGDLATVQALLAKGADVNAEANSGLTALQAAASAGHLAIIEVLLAHGADVTVKARDGNTAETFAAAGGHRAVVDMLRAKQANTAIGKTSASGTSELSEKSDSVAVKDGSKLTGRIKAGKARFQSAFGEVPVDLAAVASFGQGVLHLADGSVLKGSFSGGDLAIATGVGDVAVPLQSVEAIEREGLGNSRTAETALKRTEAELTRERAKALLETKRDLAPPYLRLYMSISAPRASFGTSAEADARCLPSVRAQFKPSKTQADSALEESDWIDFDDALKNNFFAVKIEKYSDYTWHCFLKVTEKGARFIKGTGDPVLPIASGVEIIEISGITRPAIPSGQSVAVVEFLWRMRLTELGQALSVHKADIRKYKGRALFVLYDDGWRVSEVELSPQ